MEETTIWKGSSSPVVNLGVYILCVLGAGIVIGAAIAFSLIVLCALIVPLAFGLVRKIINHSRVYEVTTQRVKITNGILTKRTDELELYRVKDTTLIEPFHYRLFSVGNILLNTNDPSTPALTLEAIPHASNLREEIRKNVEACRERKRVRVSELE